MTTTAQRSARSHRRREAGFVERWLRAIGCGILFAVFGVGAVILAVIVIPLVAWLRPGDEPADLTAQRWVSKAFAAFRMLSALMRMIVVEYVGAERFPSGAKLVVSNHPTLLDVVYLVALMPQADCVVKREAWSNPALGLMVRAAHYIPNDQGEELVEACSERLRAGRTLVLFPEGTRSPPEGLRKFQRGAAHIALHSGCPIVPVTIRCEPPALKKGQPWYAQPKQLLRYTFEVGEPRSPAELAAGAAGRGEAARLINDWMRSYFEERLGAGRSPAADG